MEGEEEREGKGGMIDGGAERERNGKREEKSGVCERMGWGMKEWRRGKE